jgi:hypothetical protein
MIVPLPSNEELRQRAERDTAESIATHSMPKTYDAAVLLGVIAWLQGYNAACADIATHRRAAL